MPLVHFFETSFGRVYSRRILLVSVEADGVRGWGECVAGEDPYYSPEWTETAWPTIKSYLAPLLLAERVGRGRDCAARFARVRGHRMAKAALENAVWDAEARQKQLPLWKLLGGTRREIACGVSIGIQDSPEQLLQKIATELAAGYRRIKIKVKPGWDLNVLEKIRARWADIVLSVDANSAYTLDEVEHLRKFDAFNLLMIEQPLWNDEIYLHARLQKAIRDGDLSGRIDSQCARCRFCAGNRRVPDPQHQGRTRGRFQRGEENTRCCAAPQCSRMVWRNAGIGSRTRRTISRFRRWRISACREMCRHRSDIGKKTLSSRKWRSARDGTIAISDDGRYRIPACAKI